MILVDTSVWIEHLHRRDDALVAQLEARNILVHPFVVGELALGQLRSGGVVLQQLELLPQAETATATEVLGVIERRRLSGTGIGYVDAHLLAAAFLRPGTLLWTFDKRLAAVAVGLALAYQPPR